MAHSSIPMTISTCMSRLPYLEAPFEGEAGTTGYLMLDVAMNHVGIAFREKRNDDPAIMLDHSTGVILIEMPAKLTGCMADMAVLDERGMASLKHLIFGADLTSTGIAVRSPKEYQQHLAFIVGRARDYAALGAEVEIQADAMSMAQLCLVGMSPSGAWNARAFSSAILFKDQLTGLVLDSEQAVAEGVLARIKAGQANGVLACGLQKRLFELMQVGLSRGRLRAQDELDSTLRGLKRNSGQSYASYLKVVATAAAKKAFEFAYAPTKMEFVAENRYVVKVDHYAQRTLQRVIARRKVKFAQSKVTDNVEEEWLSATVIPAAKTSVGTHNAASLGRLQSSVKALLVAVRKDSGVGLGCEVAAGGLPDHTPFSLSSRPMPTRAKLRRRFVQRRPGPAASIARTDDVPILFQPNVGFLAWRELAVRVVACREESEHHASIFRFGGQANIVTGCEASARFPAVVRERPRGAGMERPEDLLPAATVSHVTTESPEVGWPGERPLQNESRRHAAGKGAKGRNSGNASISQRLPAAAYTEGRSAVIPKREARPSANPYAHIHQQSALHRRGAIFLALDSCCMSPLPPDKATHRLGIGAINADPRIASRPWRWARGTRGSPGGRGLGGLSCYPWRRSHCHHKAQSV